MRVSALTYQSVTGNLDIPCHGMVLFEFTMVKVAILMKLI